MSPHPLRLAVILAAALGLVGCTPPNLPPPGGSTPTASTVLEPEPTSGTVAPGQALLPVYYAADDNGRLVLFREFHRLTVADDAPASRVRAAVTEMLARTAKDPDYTSLWPAGATVRDVRAGADTVTVDLAGAATNTSVGAEASAQALQQLIWTVTAASGKPKVVVKLDGASATELWGHLDISQPMRRGSATDVLAPVWLIDPQHGATVGRTFTVHLAGIVFEAQAHLRITKDGVLVADRPVHLSAGAPAQGTAKVSITLEPGTYVVEAFEVSAKDGTAQHIDDHTITVR